MIVRLMSVLESCETFAQLMTFHRYFMQATKGKHVSFDDAKLVRKRMTGRMEELQGK